MEQNKLQTLQYYPKTIEFLKNMHDNYLNLPRLGAYHLFIGEDEGGIFQIYPAMPVEATYNFKTRPWYWQAVEA